MMQNDLAIKLELQHEIRDNSHRLLLWLTGTVAWLSLADLAVRTELYTWPILTTVSLGCGTILSGILRFRFPRCARGVLACAMLAGLVTAIMTYSSSSLRYLSVLIVGSFSLVLPRIPQFVLALCLCTALVLVELLVPSVSIGWPDVAAASLLTMLSFVVSTISLLPLADVLHWTSTSASTALQLTKELRQRQLVLNRTLRAMDEANERLAVLNQRLEEARRVASPKASPSIRHFGSCRRPKRSSRKPSPQRKSFKGN